MPKNKTQDIALAHPDASDALSLLDAMFSDVRRQAGFLAGSDVEDLAFALSHDLRTPLRQLSAFAELLRRRIGPDISAETDELITHLSKGATQMRSMIDELAAYCRIQDTRSVETVCLKDCVEAVSENLRGQLGERQPEITCHQMPVVRGDAEQIKTVVRHLILNAVQYNAHDRPRIVFGSTRRGPIWWRLSVTDNGIGIDPKFAQEIFRVFRRLHPSDGEDNVGMGLAVCKRIVSVHGGRIWLDTDHGSGARFLIDWPA